jgi:hypothetical protein
VKTDARVAAAREALDAAYFEIQPNVVRAAIFHEVTHVDDERSRFSWGAPPKRRAWTRRDTLDLLRSDAGFTVPRGRS